jgi:putative cell wall-binding protein
VQPRTLLASSRSTLSGLLAIAAMVAATFLAAAPASADHDVSPARLEGENRFATAAEIARFDHPGGSGVALVANGMGFADALAASPLSRSTVAPLLLTQRDVIPAATDQAFEDLGVQEVVLLGGTAAISAELEAALQDRFDRVTRFEGDTRFDTAAAIGASIDASPNASVGEIEGERTAMIVNAFAPADAVLAGAFAAGQPNPFPVLFTEQGTLTGITEQALTDLSIEHVIIVGGELAVGSSVEDRLADLGMNPTRLGGSDRLATATLVADHAQLLLGWDTDLVNLARGDDFADALAAGPYAGRAGAPILLTENPTALGNNTATWLEQECPNISTIRAIGGQAAVTTAVLESAEQRAESCHAGTQQTFLVAPQEPVEVSVGDHYEFDVISRYDDQPFTGPVNAAIFPCRSANVVGADPQTFEDADGDGNADFITQSDTGSAAIVGVNGTATPASGQVRDVSPEGDMLSVQLRAEAEDCAVFVVYDDVNGNAELDVDANGEPTEPYGVGQISWT